MAQTGPAIFQMSTAVAATQKRIDSLTDLSFDALQIPSKRAEARKYAVEAQQLATGINYHKGLGDSYMRLGKIEADDGRWAESLFNYRQAIRIRWELGNLPGTASCYNMLADMFKLRGDLDSAAVSFREGIALMKGQPLDLIVPKLYSNLGHIYSRTGKYAAAKSTLDSAIILCAAYSKANNGAGRNVWADARMNLAELLQTRLNRTGEARDSLFKCLDDYKALGNDVNIGKCLLLLGNNAYYEHDMETARESYQQGLNMGDRINPTDYYILCRNRGRTYLDQSQFDKALIDFKTTLAAFQKQENHPETAGVLFELGNYFNEVSLLDSAVYYYKAALEYNIQDPTLKGRVLYFLSDVLYQNGQETEAQRFSEEYLTLLENLTADQSKETQSAFEEMTWHFMDKNRLQRR
ncbi:MAG: tetratricopeptide repeat protein, partial [Saprospiraceae bacterium]|nr:tetratricopeptide repeat protein [Saprospiraceae bacterium]